MQTLVVGIVIAAAAAYVAVKFYRRINPKGKGSGTKCDGCAYDCGLKNAFMSKDMDKECVKRP